MKTASNKANQKKLNEVAQAARKALEEWRKEYIEQGMRPLIWGYDYKEMKLIVDLLKLKIYNQTASEDDDEEE